MDQNGSNLIKFGFLTYQKMLLKNVVTFIITINMVNFFGSDQIKSVQNGSKWIKFGFLTYLPKNVTIKSSYIYLEFSQHFWTRSDQMGQT